MNVVPIQGPPEGDGATCPGCGAAVAPDQRYCLGCGQPCSPVRLAFLDVLRDEHEQRNPVSIVPPPVGYVPAPQEQGALGWLRPYQGLLGLLSVLLTTGLIGLLVGHWTVPSKAPAAQVLKIEGGLPVAAGPVGASSTPTVPTSSPSPEAQASKSTASHAQEVKEVKEAESPKAKIPKPVKTSSSSLQKISKLKGKKYQQEVNKLIKGDQPIETGG